MTELEELMNRADQGELKAIVNGILKRVPGIWYNQTADGTVREGE